MAILRRRTRDRAPRLVVFLILLAVVGEAGHTLLDQFNLELGHHLFHILFPVIAFIVFAVFVARDVRRNGWPRFAWRLP